MTNLEKYSDEIDFLLDELFELEIKESNARQVEPSRRRYHLGRIIAKKEEVTAKLEALGYEFDKPNPEEETDSVIARCRVADINNVIKKLEYEKSVLVSTLSSMDLQNDVILSYVKDLRLVQIKIDELTNQVVNARLK